jgi:hypothetical protein
MLGVALVGALVVFTADARRESAIEQIASKLPDLLIWVNLSAADAAQSDENWTQILLGSLDADSVEFVNFASDGASASELTATLAEREDLDQIDIATLWVGPEDLLSGTPLEVFELSFAVILQQLVSRSALVVGANIPDLTTELVAAQLAKHDVVQQVIEQWNSSIARLVSAAGGTIVDLHGPTSRGVMTYQFLRDTSLHLDEAAQEFVARHFAEALTEALLASSGSRDALEQQNAPVA